MNAFVRVRVELVVDQGRIAESHEFSSNSDDDDGGNKALASCLSLILKSCDWGYDPAHMLLAIAAGLTRDCEIPQLKALGALFESWGGESDLTDFFTVQIDAGSLEHVGWRLRDAADLHGVEILNLPPKPPSA